jgi:hypothetical protein
MVRHVGDVVGAVDQTFGIDQEAVAAGKSDELVTSIAGDSVRRADLMVDIAQQLEREPLSACEREVLGG